MKKIDALYEGHEVDLKTFLFYLFFCYSYYVVGTYRTETNELKPFRTEIHGANDVTVMLTSKRFRQRLCEMSMKQGKGVMRRITIFNVIRLSKAYSMYQILKYMKADSHA